MTTARNVIAEAIAGHLSAGARAIGDHHTAAADVVRALLSAPESTRLELAALLNPWRPIEEAKIGTWIEACYLGQAPVIVSHAGNRGWINLDSVSMPEPAFWRQSILPAPPSEGKT